MALLKAPFILAKLLLTKFLLPLLLWGVLVGVVMWATGRVASWFGRHVLPWMLLAGLVFGTAFGVFLYHRLHYPVGPAEPTYDQRQQEAHQEELLRQHLSATPPTPGTANPP
ncbi:hypothetical protein E3E12_02555 [Formicincola oecophyllae]|uniref:Uncharacterized protein n=1 Tax=Formicincola oecophyllae TaxID=2558361 RepID=A0A4Y6UA05_9PROT|nr:hypothetical protein [Formicincola oecophyllae]QDH13267.1 hypothetical protein E3E12_02555 [Formicincola oecophyllae]